MAMMRFCLAAIIVIILTQKSEARGYRKDVALTIAHASLPRTQKYGSFIKEGYSIQGRPRSHFTTHSISDNPNDRGRTRGRTRFQASRKNPHEEVYTYRGSGSDTPYLAKQKALRERSRGSRWQHDMRSNQPHLNHGTMARVRPMVHFDME